MRNMGEPLGALRQISQTRFEPERGVMTAALTIVLDDETLAKLDALAAETNRPRDWHVVRAIEDYAALNAWQISWIKEGIAQAARGEFATDEEVDAIFDELRAKLRSRPASPEH